MSKATPEAVPMLTAATTEGQKVWGEIAEMSTAQIARPTKAIPATGIATTTAMVSVTPMIGSLSPKKAGNRCAHGRCAIKSRSAAFYALGDVS